jgi:hypothetical protein
LELLHDDAHQQQTFSLSEILATHPQKLGSFFGLPSFIEWKDAVAAGTAYSVDYFFSKAYLARNK